MDINDKYYQQDQNYMDGGSRLNDADTLDVDAGRISRFLSSFGNSHKVAWPEYEALSEYITDKRPYMFQFDLVDSCEMEAAMCCFVESETTNAQACHHDLEDSKYSSHINRGFASYNDQPAQCVGFSWAGDATAADYKGNLLMDISYRQLMDFGRKKNIPGAPMCGCMESMPAVSTAACRTVSVTNEKYSVVSRNGGLLIVQTDGAVTYSDCAGDLLTSYQGTAEQKAKLEKKLVGTCDTNAYLNEQFYVPGRTTIWQDPNPSKWQKMMGQGLCYVPHNNDLDDRDAEFRAVFAQSPNKIVRRTCAGCEESHKDVFYKRITPLPDSLNFIDLFMNNWFSTPANLLDTDFELYSTYADALAGENKWTYCNYDDPNVGFPRDCGPTGYVPCQWNSHKRNPCNRDFSSYTHCFYIEKPDPAQ